MKQGIWRYCVMCAAVLALTCGSAFAQGTPLPAKQIPQFIDPLPLLSLAGGPMETIIAGTGEITLNMFEFKASMMPSSGWPGAATYTGTWVFGYRQGPLATPPATAVGTYIGPVIVATRNQPTQIRYVNNLTSNNIFWREWTDQSIHSVFHQVYGFPMSTLGNTAHYPGPVPAVPHLHGGEDPAVTDGGPEAWFLSDQGNFTGVVTSFGAAYYTMPGVGALANEAVYRYPNSQEAAPLWFHDHLLGATRLNATFAGLAGAYAIKDTGLALPTGLDPVGLVNADTTNLRYSVPLVLQDRMFDTNGQLFFPIIGINPTAHPYWIPEFVGDTIVVNGKVWPFMNVDQQRYRFYIINGSNSRPFELFLQDQATGVQGPPMWVIATDGGYLDKPVLIDPSASGQQKKAGMQTTLTIMPGERYEIILDFNDPGWKARLPMRATFPRNLILRNIGATVIGLPNAALDGRVMQFRVSATKPIDTSYDPRSGIAIRSGTQVIKRLVNTATGALAAGVTVNKTRQLVLVEIAGPGGPLEVMLNNTSWDGLRMNGMIHTPVNGAAQVQNNWLTEFPNEGDTEVWEIVNTTMDRHPIHLHGVQFQILNRQPFNGTGYRKAYDAAFPGGTVNSPLTGLPVTYPPGVFIPDFGSPLGYAPSTASGGKYGGNPDVTPFLKGAPAPQLSYEVGWKDTAIMNPGEVTRVVVRFAPYAYDDNNPYFPYNPSALDGYYVWHCHITDHEDNEMMRPDQFVPNPAAVRTYIQGAHF